MASSRFFFLVIFRVEREDNQRNETREKRIRPSAAATTTESRRRTGVSRDVSSRSTSENVAVTCTPRCSPTPSRRADDRSRRVFDKPRDPVGDHRQSERTRTKYAATRASLFRTQVLTHHSKRESQNISIRVY